MPARTNVRLSVGKSIYKSCTTLSSQLGTFLWNMTMGYIRSVEYDYGIYQKIFSSLISPYSKVTHVHYGRHVTDCSWLSSASLNICTVYNV